LKHLYTVTKALKPEWRCPHYLPSGTIQPINYLPCVKFEDEPQRGDFAAAKMV